MTILSPDQLLEINQAGDQPVRVIDPQTQKVYVIVESERFDQLRSLISDEPLSLAEQRQLLIRAGKRAGWDDPEMDCYDNYDAEFRAPLMRVKRGDVVLVDYPYSDRAGSKVRPCVVVQNDQTTSGWTTRFW
jgi:hypothetical protein